MILNLLDLSKADEGKLTVRRMSLDIASLFNKVAMEIDVAARERDVRLEIASGVDRIEADEDLLQRTLVNLLENAVRHAPKGTVVRLECRRDVGMTQIRVADAGKGIPAAVQARIFDPFVQVDAAALPSSRAGRGLGLAFCRLAVEAHGGRIWIEDGAPGAIFVLTIPDAA
jgi:signal transduction histidine kinase